MVDFIDRGCLFESTVSGNFAELKAREQQLKHRRFRDSPCSCGD
jgi:hypothetical protein